MPAVEQVRIILERTFGFPVAESDAQIVLDRLTELARKEAVEHSVQRTDCPVCRGRGFNVDWNKNHVKCSTCNGTGISR